jgi:hypothetical protein
MVVKLSMTIISRPWRLLKEMIRMRLKPLEVQ